MSIRSVKYELEAKLNSRVGGMFSKPTGKLERKSYEDHSERLKITLRNLKVPNESVAIVSADGLEIAQVPIQKGVGRFDKESRGPAAFPKLEVDQKIEVHVNGALILDGALRVD